MQSLIKHCFVRVFEEINIVLNALFVALWLVQAQLQILQTHLKLFLCLQITTNRINQIMTPQQHISALWWINFLPFCKTAKYSQWACSGGEASAHYFFYFSLLLAPGLWSGGSPLWQEPVLLPCWPGEVEKLKIIWQSEMSLPLCHIIFIWKIFIWTLHSRKHKINIQIFQDVDADAWLLFPMTKYGRTGVWIWHKLIFLKQKSVYNK